MLNFFMAHRKIIILIYAVIGGLVFLGVLFFVLWASYTDYHDEAKFCEDYERHKRQGPVLPGLVLGVLAGLPCGALWSFMPVLVTGLWLFDITVKKFPTLMGHLSDDEE